MDSKKKRFLGCLGSSVSVLFLLTLGGFAAVWSSIPDPIVTKPETAPNEWMLSNTSVVDVVDGTRNSGVDLVIRDGKIAQIAPTGTTGFKGEIVDANGTTVVPGLVDMHVHILGSSAPPWHLDIPSPELNLSRCLYAGVTTIFDPGDVAPDIFELREDVARGDTLGPRIYAAGPVFTSHDGHPAALIRMNAPELLAEPLIEGMVRMVGTADEAKLAVDELAPAKPDFIKLAIDRIPLGSTKIETEAAKGVIDAAKSHGIRAVAHTGDAKDTILAGELGADGWVHGVYKEPLEDDEIEKLVSFGIPMTPTLAVFKSYAELGSSDRAPTALEQQMAPAELLEAFQKRPDDHDTAPEMIEMVELLQKQKRTGIDNLGKLHAAGMRIVAGTDTQAGLIHGAALHRELALYVEAGLSPAEVLRTATLYPAQFLENTEDPSFGIVAEGKAADLLIVKGNPLEDVSALSQIEHVVLGGVKLERVGMKAK